LRSFTREIMYLGFTDSLKSPKAKKLLVI
jgi:hypothetical protein